VNGRIDAVSDRIDAVSDRIDAVVPTLATAAQLSELRGRIDTLVPTLATSAELSEVRGALRNLPTAWQMITAIVAGQCTLAALLAAIVFGVLRATGHV
jgi:hypothetical protein